MWPLPYHPRSRDTSTHSVAAAINQRKIAQPFFQVQIRFQAVIGRASVSSVASVRLATRMTDVIAGSPESKRSPVRQRIASISGDVA